MILKEDWNLVKLKYLFDEKNTQILLGTIGVAYNQIGNKEQGRYYLNEVLKFGLQNALTTYRPILQINRR